MVNGTLISFEGPEGQIISPRSRFTLLEEKEFLLYNPWTRRCRHCRKIRQVILDPDHTRMDARTELLLYIASRRRHLVERVLPALAAGKIVLMDLIARWLIKGMVAVWVWKISNGSINSRQMVLNQISPLYFDLDVEEGLARIAKNQEREVNRFWIWKVGASPREKSDKVIGLVWKNQSASWKSMQSIL